MKYTVEVMIDKDIETVSNTLKSREDALEWMEGLLEFSLKEGERDAIDSKYKMVFKQGKRTSEMTETLLKFNPPYEFTTMYEMGSVKNLCDTTFEKVGNQTKYTMVTSFEFGFFLKIFAALFPGIFKRETLKGMNQFKEYVETKK